MEQYYEITKESYHYQEYFEWKKNDEYVREQAKKFFEENDIKTQVWSFMGDKVWIEDNAENREKFDAQLSKYARNGVIAFKKTSFISKLWKSLDIKVINKPFVPLFFREAYGRMSTRLFDINGKVYCSIQTEYDDKLESPKGFIELKASEFFKIIESESESL